MQEDGTEKDEVVNEANNLVLLMNPSKPQGTICCCIFCFKKTSKISQYPVRVFE